jgi:hypothetical protein
MGPNYVGYYNLIEGNKYSILFYSTLCSISNGTLIKKKIQFFSYIRKFRVEQLKVIYEEMRKYFPINEEAVSHI